jgi:hypothetical protein
MSYADDVRGALAAVSSASRRVQALHELGLPEADEQNIIELVHQTRETLLQVADRLKVHGLLGNGLVLVASSAKKDRTQRLMAQATRPWKSVKEQVKELERAKAVPRNSAPAVEEAPVDYAHPWRNE